MVLPEADILLRGDEYEDEEVDDKKSLKEEDDSQDAKDEEVDDKKYLDAEDDKKYLLDAEDTEKIEEADSAEVEKTEWVCSFISI